MPHLNYLLNYRKSEIKNFTLLFGLMFLERYYLMKQVIFMKYFA